MYSSLAPSALRLLSLIGTLSTFYSPTTADAPSLFHSEEYDMGQMGEYPIQFYATADVTAPRMNLMATDPKCYDDGWFTLLSIRGRSVGEPGPTIVDHMGNLVWTRHLSGQTYNFQCQWYKGQQYLTYWNGDDTIAGGHGAGTYYMLNSAYEEVAHFGAGNGLEGDLHEFLITEDDTALLTIYQVYPLDLSMIPDKPVDGFIWDSVLQELELTTGKVLFEWRASEHFDPLDSFHAILGDGADYDHAYDFYHLNSIQKDKKGNYLVSARYTHTVSYVDGQTGDVIWTLGGKRNMFEDLSGGAATNFEWQHDARWVAENRISVFDNGAEAGHYTKETSRGMIVELDFERMTVRLVQEFINPLHPVTSSQGSVQILPNGNVLVGYGYEPLYTEFAADGTMLCDYHFGPRVRFEDPDVQSYRALKAPWVGRPKSTPEILIENGALFVSWNGATEVKNWVVQDSDYYTGNEEADAFFPVASVPKGGFESKIIMGDFDRSVKAYVRVAGVDKEGTMLGVSPVLETGAKKMGSAHGGPSYSLTESRPLVYFIGLCAVVSFIWLGFSVYGFLVRRRVMAVYSSLPFTEGNGNGNGASTRTVFDRSGLLGKAVDWWQNVHTKYTDPEGRNFKRSEI